MCIYIYIYICICLCICIYTYLVWLQRGSLFLAACLFVSYPSWFPCLFDKVTLPSLVSDVIKLWTSSNGTCDKINDRCAILLGLRDTENDHGLIKVILLFICNILYIVTSFGHRLQNQP